MPYMGYSAREVRESNTCPLQKSGFSIIFDKNSQAKKFRPRKHSAPVNYDVARAAKQTGSTNAFVKKMSVKVKKHSGQWGMSNLFRKNSNSALILTKTGRKNPLSKNITPRLLQKSICKLHVKTGLKNKPYAL